MRVLFLLHRFPLLTETFILNQITGLIERGLVVDILAVNKGNWAEVAPGVHRYQLPEHVTFLDPPMRRAARIATRIGLLLSHAMRHPGAMARSLNFVAHGSQATSLMLAHVASALLSRAPYDVIHCHFGPMGLLGAACRRIGAVRGKLVTTFYGYDVSSYVAQRGPRCYQRLFNAGGHCLALCEPMRQRLIQLGCDPALVRIHRIGIDARAIQPRERPGADPTRIRVLTIARLTEKKGLAYALRAIAQALARHPHLEYTIVGDGSLQAELQTLARQLGIEARVRWLGAVQHAHVMRLLHEADLFLLPSVRASDGDEEGTPTVLMEALAHGVPVLSTWHSGIPEIVEDGKSGYLVAERDVDGLTARLCDLAAHSERWPAMGAAGRRFVEREFDINTLNDRLVEIYRLIAAS